MNKKEISEIKKQFSPDNCCITCTPLSFFSFIFPISYLTGYVL